MSVFGAGLLSVPLYKIAMIMLEGRMLVGVGYLALLLVLCCGLLAVILFAKAEEAEQAKNKARVALPETPTKTNTTAKLLTPDQFDSLPSVTERTTELLYAEKEVRDKKD